MVYVKEQHFDPWPLPWIGPFVSIDFALFPGLKKVFVTGFRAKVNAGEEKKAELVRRVKMLSGKDDLEVEFLEVDMKKLGEICALHTIIGTSYTSWEIRYSHPPFTPAMRYPYCP